MGNRGEAVSSLKDIKARCIEVGECWEWQGAFSNSRSPAATIPTQYPHQPGVRARRVGAHVLAWEAANMKSSGSMMVYRTCFNKTCCNPAHLRRGTSAQMSEFLAKNGKCKRKPSAIASITRAKRQTQAKLSMDQAREIRASTEGVVALADRYGVNKSLISRIKAGKAWRESVVTSSVFSWGALAA